MFSKTSRYHSLGEHTHVGHDGRKIVYKARRIVPRTPAGGRATIGQSDRLDLMAGRILKDPLKFWRLCDANEELDPFELEARSGRSLNVPAS